MRSSFNKVCILDCIGFDQQDPINRPMQVRFAKCLVYDDGRIERQFTNDRLLCHRVTIHQGENIDARMAMECEQIEAMGYDPPAPSMIERIKAHCAIEWNAEFSEQRFLPTSEPMEFVPFDVNVGLKVQ